MKNDAVIEVAETVVKTSKRKIVVLSTLAVASVVGIMAFALAIRDGGDSDASNFTED